MALATLIEPADAQQKGFYSRSIRKLESLLDKGNSSGLALDPDISTRLNAEQRQLLHLNRALLYLLSGGRQPTDCWGRAVKSCQWGCHSRKHIGRLALCLHAASMHGGAMTLALYGTCWEHLH